MRNVKNTPKNKIVGDALMNSPAAPKHKAKSKPNVLTSNFQHPTTSTAITLVALVITIIVLLILAGVTLSMVIGENGIFGKANEAKEKTNIANIKEQIQMEIANKQVLNDGSITEGELEDILKEYGTINYEEDEKTIKGITTKEGEYEIGIGEIYNGKTTTEVKKIATQAITEKNYGDEVNYSANGVDSWKVFLNDGTNIYMIASDYVPTSGMTLGEGISQGDGNYCVKGDSQSNLLNWLTDSSMWTAYANGISGLTGMATGGPTLEQFWSSYNKKYQTNYSLEVQSLSSEVGYNNTLYFPHKEAWNLCFGYRISSANSENASCIENLSCNGGITRSSYGSTNIGIRPLVCLPSGIFANKENGKWTFSK